MSRRSPAILLVDQLDLGGKETGAYDIAVDTAQAGPGETFLVMDEGNGARQILGLDPGAIRTVVVGVVDEVSVDSQAVSVVSPAARTVRRTSSTKSRPPRRSRQGRCAARAPDLAWQALRRGLHTQI